jgi:hypothetical protein
LGLLKSFKIAKDVLSFENSNSSKSFSLCEKNAFSEEAQIAEIIKQVIIAKTKQMSVGMSSEGMSFKKSIFSKRALGPASSIELT